jgi:acyl carrier protein
MKPKTAYRSAFALLFLTTIYLFTVPVTVYAGGKKDQNNQVREGKILLRTEPAYITEADKRLPSDNETEIYVKGISEPFDTMAKSWDGARYNGGMQIIERIGHSIERRAETRGTINDSTRNTLEVYIDHQDEITRHIQSVLSEVSVVRYYSEVWLTRDRKEEYIGYAICKIPREKLENEIANLEKNISGRYENLLKQSETVNLTLEGYVLVAKALEDNPLHRVTAYYEGPNGKVGMYEYVQLRINELTNSVKMEAIPARTIQETDTLYTPIRLQSSIIKSTGPINCQARLFGVDNEDIRFSFRTSSEDPYNLSVRDLKPGIYTVAIELLMSEMTNGIAKNSGGGFTFEVTALNPILLDIETGIKKAVDTFAKDLPILTETRIGPFFMTGTDIPSGLSRFLDERIRHYARINQERKYRIITGEAEHKAELTGFFSRRNDHVDITLVLSTTLGEADSSQIFSISVAELERLGIAIEPENISEVNEIDKLLIELIRGGNVNGQSSQDIHIEAEFNSESRTYLHRGELIFTVKADRDCYFKVVHIDANNRMRTIYPNSIDRDNYLNANRSRTIFDSAARYMLYEPYGTETILIVASTEQFRNIEQEYISPWTVATTEIITTSVRGSRGGDLEIGGGSGVARYSITILKPHEEYEHKRPENMFETYMALRDDALRQGGIFNGNETSGFYIINNIRGSYRIPRDAPNTIRFATYYLDNYTNGPNAGIVPESGVYNFSFAKPGNIVQAIQAVKNGIEGKGGVFTGNEQQGSFKASGIAGRYQVHDLVSVEISEKPAIIPYILIEKEIKRFFGR